MLFDFQDNENFGTTIEIMVLNGDAFSQEEFTAVMRGHYGVAFTNALYSDKVEPPCENKIECNMDCVVRSFCVHRK